MDMYPQIALTVFLLAIAGLVAWLLCMVPLWPRPSIYFGVTVAPDFRGTPEARRLLRNFRVQATIHTLITFALILATMSTRNQLLLVAAEIWLVAGPALAFLGARKHVLPYAVAPSTVREAVLATHLAHLPGGWILQLMPFLILLTTAVFVRLHWDQIPERFPVHWGTGGQPTGWSVRTPMGVYGPLLFAAALVAVILLTVYGITHSARRDAVAGSGQRRPDAAHRIALLLTATEFFAAALFSIRALLPFTGEPPMLPLLVGVLAFLGFLIFLQIPLIRARAVENSPLGDGTPDSCWKLGMFYFNRDDSALFVEKRFGVGYTMNFGHVSAWIITGLALLIPVLAALLRQG